MGCPRVRLSQHGLAFHRQLPDDHETAERQAPPACPEAKLDRHFDRLVVLGCLDWVSIIITHSVAENSRGYLYFTSLLFLFIGVFFPCE